MRKRTFELDWNYHTIYTHRQFDRFPTLVGITCGTWAALRSILVFEMLCAMRAVAFDDADSLKSSIAEHFTSFDLYTPLERLQQFQSTRVIDVLRFQSGWQSDRVKPEYPYATAVLDKRALRSNENDGVRRLPLKPGDFRLFVKGSKLDFGPMLRVRLTYSTAGAAQTGANTIALGVDLSGRPA